MKDFFCHYCGEIVKGSPDISVKMFLGFIWSPEKHSDTTALLDFCPDCTKMFLKMYKLGRETRKAELARIRAAEFKRHEEQIELNFYKGFSINPQFAGKEFTECLHHYHHKASNLRNSQENASLAGRKLTTAGHARTAKRASGRMEHVFLAKNN